MIYSILFKFPASWWITSHRLLTSSTTSATFSALHGTHVKVPKNNDIMDLISSQRLDESYHIVQCPFTSSTWPATSTALHGTQVFLLKIHQIGSIFLQQAITLLIIPFIHTLLRSLISFFLLDIVGPFQTEFAYCHVSGHWAQSQAGTAKYGKSVGNHQSSAQHRQCAAKGFPIVCWFLSEQSHF